MCAKAEGQGIEPLSAQRSVETKGRDQGELRVTEKTSYYLKSFSGVDAVVIGSVLVISKRRRPVNSAKAAVCGISSKATRKGRTFFKCRRKARLCVPAFRFLSRAKITLSRGRSCARSIRWPNWMPDRIIVHTPKAAVAAEKFSSLSIAGTAPLFQ